MPEAIRHLARQLDISDAELLLLAREAAGDSTILFLEELHKEHAHQLLLTLEQIEADTLVVF